MSSVRGTKRKVAMEVEMGKKKERKVDEEKVTKVVEKVTRVVEKVTKVVEKVTKVGEIVKKEVDEKGYRCPLCSLELNCAHGDRVMKGHIRTEHFTPGSLLEMVGLDLEEGQKLR